VRFRGALRIPAGPLADRILVMKEGKIIEQGDIQSLLKHPKHASTQQLLSVAPIQMVKKLNASNILLQVNDLNVSFPIKKGIF